MGNGQIWHDRLGLEPTNLQDHYAPPAPADSFDPLTAEPEELMRYGFPARPDAANDAAAHARWKRQFGRALTYVAPELQILAHRSHGPMAHPAEVDEQGTSSGPNWAGNVVLADEGEKFTGVMGQWTVPSVNQPLGGPFVNGASSTSGIASASQWSSSAWIGIDGANLNGVDSADVFQAGTEHDLTVVTFGSPFNQTIANPVYYVWTEWFPAAPVAVTNFSVSPGDLIVANLTIIFDPTVAKEFPIGQSLLLNATRAEFTNVLMLGPPNNGSAPFKGNSAEWIVETPCTANCTKKNPTYAALPYLGMVGFFETNAITSKGAGVSGATGSSNGAISPNLFQINLQNSYSGPGRTGKPAGTPVAVELSPGFGVQND